MLSSRSFNGRTRLFLWTLLLSCGAGAMSTLPKPPSKGKILVVGATGGTGLRALNGILDVGFRPQQIRLTTRNPDKESLKPLRDMGFDLCKANLDNRESLVQAMDGCWGCYIHSLSSDTKKLDTNEVSCAKNFASAFVESYEKDENLKYLVYNSAAGEPNHGVDRAQQKQDAEQVFYAALHGDMAFTSLRAHLFMEELWKKYTRPAILKGSFPFSVKSDRQIYLTSVRDMGRLAGACLLQPASFGNRTINVAGDVLSASDIAAEFSKAQDAPCVHKQGRLFALLTRLFFRELYQQIRFYRTTTETTDIKALSEEFPNLLSSFGDFLKETRWGNRDLGFENFTIATDS